MPRGQTMEHFPHSMQFLIMDIASFSFPRWSARMTLRMLMPENLFAGHVELQDPQAMHL